VANEGRGPLSFPKSGRAEQGLGLGIGILGMREQAKQIRARFEITSGPDGTTVRVILPRFERITSNDDGTGLPATAKS
jgi:signal transduction histidine kinase